MIKKAMSLFLCLMLVFSFLPLSFISSAETIQIGVINEPGEKKIGVIVRDDASKKSKKNTTVWSETIVNVIGSKNDIDNEINTETGKTYIWHNITYQSDGITYTGYVREDMIDVTTYELDKKFEEQLAEFPESYHAALTVLHAQYPNWIFQADKIDMTFDEAVLFESDFKRKLVMYKDAEKNRSWWSMDVDSYDWNTNKFASTDNGLYTASREVIQYYMDPRNFLNANDIYVFMKQDYDPVKQTEDGVRKHIEGTFLANKYEDHDDTTYEGDYAKILIEAAKRSGVNPYILASTIIQEQGSNGGYFSDGSATYNGNVVYNFFNVGATGDNETQIKRNGSEYADKKGWTTRSASIIGGANFYSGGYVNSHPEAPYYNQDTYFYKNFNIINKDNTHQYAQNISDQVSKASFLRKMYSTDFTSVLTFRIPVYKNNSLPKSPTILPERNGKYNNYYFNTIEVNGLTPSFERYKYQYALQVDNDQTVYVNIPETATITSPMSFKLKKGNNIVKLTVKSQTGFTNDYVINVDATADCLLTVTTTDEPVILKGDINNDGKISVSDQAAVRLHILEKATLTDDAFKAADINNDGKISVSDQAAIRLHILKIIELN